MSVPEWVVNGSVFRSARSRAAVALCIPVLGLVFGAVVGGVVFGVVAAAAPGSRVAERGTTEQFVVLATLAQAGFLLAAVLGGVLLGPSVPRALGLVRAKLPALAWPVLFGGGFFLWATLTISAQHVMRWLGVEPSEHLQDLSSAVNADTVPLRALLLLAAAALPGVCEEVMARGVVQRTLAGVWPAWAAIGASSVLFALLHIDPQHVAMIASLGVWWGYVAHRTGSTWPTIGLHMLNNALAMGAMWTMPQGGWPALLAWVLVPTGVCFAASFLILERGARRSRRLARGATIPAGPIEPGPAPEMNTP